MLQELQIYFKLVNYFRFSNKHKKYTKLRMSEVMKNCDDSNKLSQSMKLITNNKSLFSIDSILCGESGNRNETDANQLKNKKYKSKNTPDKSSSHTKAIVGDKSSKRDDLYSNNSPTPSSSTSSYLASLPLFLSQNPALNSLNLSSCENFLLNCNIQNTNSLRTDLMNHSNSAAVAANLLNAVKNFNNLNSKDCSMLPFSNMASLNSNGYSSNNSLNSFSSSLSSASSDKSNKLSPSMSPVNQQQQSIRNSNNFKMQMLANQPTQADNHEYLLNKNASKLCNDLAFKSHLSNVSLALCDLTQNFNHNASLAFGQNHASLSFNPFNGNANGKFRIFIFSLVVNFQK